MNKETNPSIVTVENGIKPQVNAISDENSVEPRGLKALQVWVINKYNIHNKVIRTLCTIVVALFYFMYVGYALSYKFGDEGSWRLLGFTVFGVLLFVTINLYRVYRGGIHKYWESTLDVRNSKTALMCFLIIRWLIRLAAVSSVMVYVILGVAIDRPENLISVAGIVLYLFITFITSTEPSKVNWHTIFWGIVLQFWFAILILRTNIGYEMFKWLGDRVSEFLDHSLAGVVFVFGEKYEDHFIAMKVLPIIVFFCSTINILYYLGLMQAIVKVLGRFLAFCLQTTPAESINAASNIFFGMGESAYLVRPFLRKMTNSELHAVITCGFSTIAGSVLGVYITFGVQANHLLAASVMSAPAALAISKLSYPETEVKESSSEDFEKMEKSSDHNIIEAASNGAIQSIKIVAAMATNLIAFQSMLALLNATLTWFGNRAGVEELTFEFICSYVLYPVSFFMGVEVADCGKIAELIGVRMFANEFVAYGQLRQLITNHVSLSNYTAHYNTSAWYWHDGDIYLNITGDILTGGVISEKSEVIVTYALCGFADFGSIGVILGALTALVPSRRSHVTSMVIRAMICGNVACFLTACIAGLLYQPF